MIFHNILLLMHFVWQCYDVKLSSCRRPISLFIAFIMQMLQNVMWSWLSARAGINSIHSGYSILLVSGILFRQIKAWRKTRWKELVYILFVCKLLQMALDISPAQLKLWGSWMLQNCSKQIQLSIDILREATKAFLNHQFCCKIL